MATKKPQPSTPTTIVQVPLLQIQITGSNPRTTFPEDYISELAETIGTIGIQTPLWVREVNGSFFLIAGECRYRAAERVMLSHVPCIIKDVDERGALELQILENLHRRDVSPIEEGRGYQRLLQQHGYTIEQLVKQLSKSKSYIYGRVKLADLPQLGQEALASGELSPSVALRVARIPGSKLQIEALQRIISTPHLQTDRAAAELIEHEFCRELKGAPFDPTDTGLIPERGACQQCPRRSGNQTDLFPDQIRGRGDICTDPACYQAKSDTSWIKLSQATASRGGHAFEGDAADTIYRHGWMNDRDWMRLDWTLLQHRHASGLTLDELLADCMPPVSVLRTAEGEVLRLARRADVEQRMEELGIEDPDKEREEERQSLATEREQRVRERVADEAVNAAITTAIYHAVATAKVDFRQEDLLLAAIIKALSVDTYGESLRQILHDLGILANDDSGHNEQRAALCQWVDAGRWVRADLQSILLRLTLEPLYGEDAEKLRNAAATIYGVDIAAIEEQTRTALLTEGPPHPAQAVA